MLSPNLSLLDYIQNTVGHVTGRLNTLSTLRKYIPHNVALTIYKETILSPLEYANVIYTLIPYAQRAKLQRLQNRALRIVFRHSADMDLTILHTRANLGTLAQRCNRQLLCLMYRRAQLSDHFPTEIICSSTRANNKIKFILPKPTSERFKQFPLYQGAGLWDNLEVATQKANDYEIFKMKMSKKPDFNSFPVA